MFHCFVWKRPDAVVASNSASSLPSIFVVLVGVFVDTVVLVVFGSIARPGGAASVGGNRRRCVVPGTKVCVFSGIRRTQLGKRDLAHVWDLPCVFGTKELLVFLIGLLYFLGMTVPLARRDGNVAV